MVLALDSATASAPDVMRNTMEGAGLRELAALLTAKPSLRALGEAGACLGHVPGPCRLAFFIPSHLALSNDHPSDCKILFSLDSILGTQGMNVLVARLYWEVRGPHFFKVGF